MTEPDRDNRFVGRSALVTGGGRGLGRAIAQAFCAAGANVTIADLDGESAVGAAGDVQTLGPGRAIGVGCDVCDGSAVTAAMAQAVASFGALDVVVSNAGVAGVSPVVDMAEEEWDSVMAVNAKGVFLCTQAALRIMLPTGQGNIVNIASQAGKHGIPRMAHYCASKAAVLNFSRSLAIEVAPIVRVNCVCPGIVDTEMVENEVRLETKQTAETREAVVERWTAGVPLGRFQPAEKIAAAVLFLASDEASEITGEALHVDGGMVMD